MKNYATVGTCPICGQGRQIVARDTSSGALYILCEECESEWARPEHARDLELATHNVFGQSVFLLREELDGHDWRMFLS